MRTEQNTRWLRMEIWNHCIEDLPDLSGCLYFAGLALAGTTDIAALALAFPIGRMIHFLPFFSVPSEDIKRR